MFTHIRVGSTDPKASLAFYDATFAALGIEGQHVSDTNGMYRSESGVFFVGPPADGAPATHANGGTIGLAASSKAQVDAWHAAGMTNGGSDEGAPGPREFGAEPMYGAYLRDPVGNKLCVFVMGDAAR